MMKRNMIGLNWPHPLTSVCKDFKNDGTAVLPVLATRNATDLIRCFSLAYQIIDVVSYYTWAMVTVSMTHTTSFMQGCDNPQYTVYTRKTGQTQ